jgi:hypothetical protein
MKWLGVIVLVIVGALATFVAVEYFTVAIHALPSYIPGHHATGPHGLPARGHYRKRGAVAAVIALIAFVVAGFLAYRILRSDNPPAAVEAPTPAPPTSSVDQII